MLHRATGVVLAALIICLGTYVLAGKEVALKHLLIGLAVPAVLGGLYALGRGMPARATDGWTALRPGAMHLVGLVLCGLLTGVLAYVYLFVGSSRADAARQMMYLAGLLVAFGAGTLYLAFVCFLAQTRWNGEGIERWAGPWRTTSMRWSDLAALAGGEPGEAIRLTAKDGTRLKIDPYLAGIEALLGELARRGFRPIPSYGHEEGSEH